MRPLLASIQASEPLPRRDQLRSCRVDEAGDATGRERSGHHAPGRRHGAIGGESDLSGSITSVRRAVIQRERRAGDGDTLLTDDGREGVENDWSKKATGGAIRTTAGMTAVVAPPKSTTSGSVAAGALMHPRLADRRPASRVGLLSAVGVEQGGRRWPRMVHRCYPDVWVRPT